MQANTLNRSVLEKCFKYLWLNSQSRENSNLFAIDWKLELSNKIDNVCSSLQHSQPFHVVIQESTENLEFPLGVNIEKCYSLQINVEKDLITFDVSFQVICTSKISVGVATTGRRRGLGLIYSKRSCFSEVI